MGLTGFFREAGILAIPIVALGGVSLWLAVLYVRRARREHFALALGFTVATVLAGCLGTVVGFQISLRHLATLAAERRYIIGIGMREAMNDLVLSLIFALVATLILAWGWTRRAAQQRVAESLRDTTALETGA
jgi:hypothetical protein